MSNLSRIVLFSTAAAVFAATAVTPASAEYRNWGGHRPYYDRGYDRHDRRDAVALGLFGLATGVIVGSAIANQPRYVEPEPDYVAPRYVAPQYAPPPPRYVAPPAVPVYDTYQPVRRPATYGLQPWTGEWYRYCAERYRSFNERTGTYIGYDNRAHFCTAG